MGLMEPVAHGDAQGSVLARHQGMDEEPNATQVRDSLLPGYGGRKHGSGIGSRKVNRGQDDYCRQRGRIDTANDRLLWTYIAVGKHA